MEFIIFIINGSTVSKLNLNKNIVFLIITDQFWIITKLWMWAPIIFEKFSIKCLIICCLMFIFGNILLNFKIRLPFYGIDARKYFVYFIYIAKQSRATKKIFFLKFHDQIIYFKMQQNKTINFCTVCTYNLHSLKSPS